MSGGKQAHSTPLPSFTPRTQITLSLGCMILALKKYLISINDLNQLDLNHQPCRTPCVARLGVVAVSCDVGAR